MEKNSREHDRDTSPFTLESMLYWWYEYLLSRSVACSSAVQYSVLPYEYSSSGRVQKLTRYPRTFECLGKLQATEYTVVPKTRRPTLVR